MVIALYNCLNLHLNQNDAVEDLDLVVGMGTSFVHVLLMRMSMTMAITGRLSLHQDSVVVHSSY